jgi:hypothetical protein
VIKIVGEYGFNWGLVKAVNRDYAQQSLYEFLFIENALIFKGKQNSTSLRPRGFGDLRGPHRSMPPRFNLGPVSS